MHSFAFKGDFFERCLPTGEEVVSIITESQQTEERTSTMRVI